MLHLAGLNIGSETLIVELKYESLHFRYVTVMHDYILEKIGLIDVLLELQISKKIGYVQTCKIWNHSYT